MNSNTDRVINGVRVGLNVLLYALRLSLCSYLLMISLMVVHEHINPNFHAAGFWHCLILVSIATSMYAVFKYVRPIEEDAI